MRAAPLLLLLLLGCASVARAQDYESSLREAVAQFAHGQWAEARVSFARAHTLQPSARTLRGLGMVDFNLGAYPRAVAELEAALASTTLPLPEPLREQVSQLQARAQRYVGHVEVRVRPESALLTVDGDVPLSDQRGQLILALGSHVLRATAPGYTPGEQVVRIELPGQTTVTLSLARVPPPPPKLVEVMPSPLRPWAWTASITAPALLATSGAFWLGSNKRYDELQSYCRRKVCVGEVDGAQEVTRLDRASQVMLAVGASLAVTAVVLWTLERRHVRTDKRLARWQYGPLGGLQ